MDVSIHWTYGVKGRTLPLYSEPLPAKEALQWADDMEKTGRVQTILFVDRYDSYWTKKQLQKYCQEIETEPSAIRIYVDGGFQREKRIAGIGVVIYYEQHGRAFRLRMNKQLTALQSNNEAEFAALLEACKQLEQLGAKQQDIHIYSDAQVVMHEMSGEWGIDAGNEWATKIEALLQRLHLRPMYEHIPRQQNKEAHRLATQALDGIFIHATKEQ